jgi:molybdate transport system substrate-binding protein
VKRKIIQYVSIGAAILVANAASILLSARQRAAEGTEVRVLASDGMKPALQALFPQIEHMIGHQVAPEFEPSKTLKQKIQAGEAFDVAILATDTLDELIQEGKIAARTRTELGRTGIGIGIRAGAPRPDIGTPEALERTMLNATSITFNREGASAVHINEMFAHLGISDKVKPKLILEQSPGQPQRDVLEGKAELVITLIPEIADFEGLELVGPLPADLQSYINFSAGVASHSPNAAVAEALIKFIVSPAAAPTLRAKGITSR